jgi:hypothetical protein
MDVYVIDLLLFSSAFSLIYLGHEYWGMARVIPPYYDGRWWCCASLAARVFSIKQFAIMVVVS